MKFKNFTPQQAESLVLSKIDYNDTVTHSMPAYLIKHLHRFQLAAASFVLNRYANMPDVLKLDLPPTLERSKFHLCNFAFKS